MMAHRQQGSPYQSLEGLKPGERMYYKAMEAKQRGRYVCRGCKHSLVFFVHLLLDEWSSKGGAAARRLGESKEGRSAALLP